MRSLVGTKKISFLPASPDVEKFTKCPQPAKNYLPDWVKPFEKFDITKADMSSSGAVLSRFVGRCMPFRDALTAGYIQESWTEILFRIGDSGNLEYYTATSPQLIDVFKNPSGNAVGSDHYPAELIMKMQWIPKTPKGYSTLVCPPLNRLDLPFTISTGIIDSDKYYHSSHGNVPFYIKAGFQGVIPLGTPLYQLIPFKRDSWISEAVAFCLEESQNRYNQVSKIFVGNYRKNFWVRKSFK